MVNTKSLTIIICIIYFGNPLYSRILLPPLEIMVYIQTIFLQCTCYVVFQVVFIC